MKTLLESCQVAPPPGAVAEQTLPLTFFDINWLFIHPICQVIFYEFPPCSKPYFLQTLLPKLKQSLSLSLKHFFPLSSRIVHPSDPDKMPVFRYREGDSVSVTIFESGDDFDYLVGNHPRDADKFYDFLPQMPPVIEESDHRLLHCLAVQVTLFPGSGVCIGTACHHSVADAAAILGFLKTWASINKLGDEEEFSTTQSESLPVFDRSLVNYPRELDSVYWNRIRKIPLFPPPYPVKTDRVRATYVFSQSEIAKLKDSVRTRFPGLARVSSFVALAAYMWSCMAKTLEKGREKGANDDDEIESFSFGVDLRGRLKPPASRNYFGNCITHALPKIRRGELVGDEGFFLAAKAIAEVIVNRLVNNENILEGAEGWPAEMWAAIRGSHFSVSGSERFDLYSVDYGWGKARKVEINTIDKDKYGMSLCRSRDSEGGLEVGLSLPKEKMEAFAAMVSQGLKGA